MDKELRELDRSEKQILTDIKKRGKQSGVTGSDPTLRALAVQLVQIRQQKEKFAQGKAQLSSMGMKASAMKSQVAMSNALGSVTTSMTQANKAVDMSAMNKIISEFSQQSEMMSMREEMMDDALCDAFDSEEVDAEADDVTNSVLAELGLQLDGQMADAPSNSLPVKQAVKESSQEEEAMRLLEGESDDLKKRLAQL